MLCTDCKQDLPWLNNHCPQCALPFAQGVQGLCGQCQSQPPHYDKVYSLFSYHPPISRLIVRLKFHHHLPIARLLGELMAAHLASQLASTPDYIIPVPLHPKRLYQRGFNQAQELAKPISKTLNIGIHSNIVERFQNKPPQTTLSRKLRLKNMQDVFRMANNAPQSHALILDDVMTTGATTNELARMLKRKGVSRVDIAVVARVGDTTGALHN